MYNHVCFSGLWCCTQAPDTSKNDQNTKAFIFGPGLFRHARTPIQNAYIEHLTLWIFSDDTVTQCGMCRIHSIAPVCSYRYRWHAQYRLAGTKSGPCSNRFCTKSPCPRNQGPEAIRPLPFRALSIPAVLPGYAGYCVMTVMTWKTMKIWLVLAGSSLLKPALLFVSRKFCLCIRVAWGLRCCFSQSHMSPSRGCLPRSSKINKGIVKLQCTGNIAWISEHASWTNLCLFPTGTDPCHDILLRLCPAK